MSENGARRRPRVLSPEAKWEIFLEVTSREVTQAEAARRHSVDVSQIGARESYADLQWRAGQLPGQTRLPQAQVMFRTRPFNGGPDNCPARQGPPSLAYSLAATFNGGPDNCPARQGSKDNIKSVDFHLQWRAGQLPGQTGHHRALRAAGDVPSMEGRTIARPDVTLWGP